MLTQIELLKKYDLRIRGHLGQHLLMDPNTIRKIVDALDLKPGDRVLEIGPGLGAMTREILSRGAHLLAVETDKKFVEVLTQELLPEYPGNFTLVSGDILKSDLTKLVCEWIIKGTGTFLGTGSPAEGGVPVPIPINFNGVEIGAVQTPIFGKKGKVWTVPLQKKSQSLVKVASNLPYYISTPILFHLIEHAGVFSEAVLMLQKEVAARLTAATGGKDYGRLSVTSRLYGDTEFLFDVSPKCFLPPPEVTSRVVRYVFRRGPGNGGEKFLLEIIRIAFSQRRKTLLSLLAHELKPKRERGTLESIFEKLGLAPKVRGEALSLEQFELLAKALD